MAKIDDDSILNHITGMLGKQIVVKRSKSGKRYLSAKPETDPNRKLTPPQAAYRKRFERQAVYARAASNDPETKSCTWKKPAQAVRHILWRGWMYIIHLS